MSLSEASVAHEARYEDAYIELREDWVRAPASPAVVARR
jgi:hypothetical protein